MKSVDRLLKLANKFEKKMQKFAQAPQMGGPFDAIVDSQLKQWQNKDVNEALNDPSTRAPEGKIYAKFGAEAVVTPKGVQVKVEALPVTQYDAASGTETVMDKESFEWSKRVVAKYGKNLVSAIKNAITPQIISKHFSEHPEPASVSSGATAQYEA